MAKKEKVVDLGQKVEKVTEQELNDLRNIVNTINTLQFEIGKIESQKHQHLHNLSAAGDKVRELQSAMEEKYGSFDIDLSDGSIKKQENEQ